MTAIVVLCFSLAIIFVAILLLLPRGDPVVVTLKIRGAIMADVNKPFAFVVEAFNALGRVVQDTGITVSLSGVPGTATVDPAGTNGVLTATAEGGAILQATDGKIVSAPFTVDVVDNTPATLVIRAA